MGLAACPRCGRPTSADGGTTSAAICPHCGLDAPAATTAFILSDSGVIQASEPPPNSVPPAALAFLAPAQGPDELGRLGGYRVLRVVGAGGMGMVLLAEDVLLKRSIALKVMLPELAARADLRQRFLREAQATAALEHPHIVPVYQVGEDRGVAFMAMPFLKGEPLDARLEREPQLPVATVLRLCRQTALALAEAHEHGLIHRDIKPANLWLEPHERAHDGPEWIKVLDFGLARLTTGQDVHLTNSGSIVGTPAYMAPEQAFGKPVDGRTDLFSLGAVGYEMLTGERAFPGADPMSTLMAVTQQEPAPVAELNPAVPPELIDLIGRMLAKSPDDRPATARQVADELAAIEQDRTQPLPALADVPAPVRPPRRPRHAWVLVLCAGALFALLGLGLETLHRRGVLAVARPRDTVPAATPAAPPRYVLPGPPWTNRLGMRMVPIPKGKVYLGRGEVLHAVELAEPYSIGAYEVTVGQFAEFAGKDKDKARYRTDAEKGFLPRLPTWRSPGFVQDDTHPVVCISWHDATEFCKWLSEKEQREYRLPTEAEWAFAARAGEAPARDLEDLKAVGWFAGNSEQHTHPVGKLRPNAWGLHDTCGNASEWMLDLLEKDRFRVARGGHWGSDGNFNTSHLPGVGLPSTGFRVVAPGHGLADGKGP